MEGISLAIGATDEAIEGQWVWIDGTPVAMGSPFWGYNYKDGKYSHQPEGGETQNFAVLYSEFFFHFNDLGDKNIVYPICDI